MHDTVILYTYMELLKTVLLTLSPRHFFKSNFFSLWNTFWIAIARHFIVFQGQGHNLVLLGNFRVTSCVYKLCDDKNVFFLIHTIYSRWFEGSITLFSTICQGSICYLPQTVKHHANYTKQNPSCIHCDCVQGLWKRQPTRNHAY